MRDQQRVTLTIGPTGLILYSAKNARTAKDAVAAASSNFGQTSSTVLINGEQNTGQTGGSLIEQCKCTDPNNLSIIPLALPPPALIHTHLAHPTHPTLKIMLRLNGNTSNPRFNTETREGKLMCQQVVADLGRFLDGEAVEYLGMYVDDLI